MVKCSECGFLALRRLDDQELVQASQIYRTEGRVPHNPARQGYETCERLPVCFELRRDFWPLPGTRPASIQAPELLEIIGRDIDCATFTQWRQGSTPKEHRELLDRQWMLDREERRDREMREREDTRDQRIQELQERLHSQEMWIIGGIVTLVLLVGSIVAAIIEGLLSTGTDLWPWG